jgi:hypothetical protein
MSVSEVGGELGELAFHVAALAVPADKGPYREPVPHVMEPRSVAMVVPAKGRAKADHARDDHEVVPGAALPDAGSGLGQEECRGRAMRDEEISLLHVALQGSAGGLVDRHEPRLAELAAPDAEDTGAEIYIVAVEGERFAQA